MALQIHAGFEKGDTFGCEKFALERGVRLADKDAAALADDAMPGNPAAGRRGGHGATGAARAAAQAQKSSERPIG
jgi:hypothetical protein